MVTSSEHPSTVRVPNVDLEDKVLFGLTWRQAAYAVGTVAAVAAVWQGLSAVASLLVAGVVCGLLTLFGAVVVFVRRDGISIDRLIWAALRMQRRPLVPAPDGVHRSPQWLNATEGSGARHVRPAVLRSPARGVDTDGIIDLGPAGVVAVLDVTGLVNFHLLASDEQQTYVARFAGVLHSLTGPIQVLITAVPVDLSAAAALLDDPAGDLPEQAHTSGRAHAAYLRALGAGPGALLRRHVLVAVAASDRSRLEQRISEVSDAVAGCGLRTSQLNAVNVLDVLALITDPYQYHLNGNPS